MEQNNSKIPKFSYMLLPILSPVKVGGELKSTLLINFYP